MTVRQWGAAVLCALALLGGTGAVAGAAPRQPAPDEVLSLLHDAATLYQLDEATFVRIAWCESHFNPYAISPGGHKGVFQFADGTWYWTSQAAGYGGASPFDAEANIYSAAWLMSQPGGYANWACR